MLEASDLFSLIMLSSSLSHQEVQDLPGTKHAPQLIHKRVLAQEWKGEKREKMSATAIGTDLSSWRSRSVSGGNVKLNTRSLILVMT